MSKQPKATIVKSLEKEIYTNFQIELSNLKDIESVIKKVTHDAIDNHYDSINPSSISDIDAASTFVKTSISALEHITSENVNDKVFRSVSFIVSDVMLLNQALHKEILEGVLYQFIHIGSWSNKLLKITLTSALEGTYLAFSNKYSDNQIIDLLQNAFQKIKQHFTKEIQLKSEKIMDAFVSNLKAHTSKFDKENYTD